MAAHRYWKLNITANVSDANVSNIAELMVAATAGGANLIGGATITASGQQGGFEATRVADGSGSSMWASNSTATFPKWLKLDFGATSSNWPDLREIRVYCDTAWFPEAPKDFNFGYSDDDATYTTVITVAGETWSYTHTGYTGNVAHVFRTADCPDTLPGYLYWRVLIDGANATSGVALGEIEFRATTGGADTSRPWGGFGARDSFPGANTFAKCFDNSASGGWFTPNPVVLPEAVGNALDQRRSIVEVALTTYTGFGANAPLSGTLQGSNDLSSWNSVVRFTNQTAWGSTETRVFNTPLIPPRRRPIYTVN